MLMNRIIRIEFNREPLNLIPEALIRFDLLQSRSPLAWPGGPGFKL